MLKTCAFFTIVLCVAASVSAQELRLEMPVDCAMGKDCLVFQYFDHDKGPGWRDYACGQRSYDGHKGTDIRVRNLAVMEKGVPVVAAAPGVVRAVRDGMDDVDVRTLPPGSMEGRGAGNVVVLVHEGVWETRYAHLKKGSVVVEQGQRVEAGQKLGLIGMSGMAAFPHVEFAVVKGLVHVDPYTGGKAGWDGCGPGQDSLWSPEAARKLKYIETDVLGAGFADRVVSMTDVEAGLQSEVNLVEDSPVLLFWVWLAGVREGDELSMVVTAPGNRVVAKSTQVYDQAKIQAFKYVGSRLAEGKLWPRGTYDGRIQLRRKAGDGSVRTVQDLKGRLFVR